MRYLLMSLLFTIVTITSHAQSGAIRVLVTNDQQAVLENASAELLKIKDSSIVKIALTDKSGIAEFENIRVGEYLVRVTAVGFMAQYSAAFNFSGAQNGFTVPKITMQTRAAQLGNATVTTKKPFIQKLSDRIVVNVDNSIVSAGSSAMDVLERSPGVNVDNNDNISLRGRSGVIIMIDGKPTANDRRRSC